MHAARAAFAHDTLVTIWLQPAQQTLGPAMSSLTTVQSASTLHASSIGGSGGATLTDGGALAEGIDSIFGASASALGSAVTIGDGSREHPTRIATAKQ